MRVVVLGSGTGVPDPSRLPSGVLVEGGGARVLVDCGPGIVRRLSAAGVGPEAVTAVLLTHFHVDHAADLTALLFALRAPRYVGRPTLRVVGGPGLSRLVSVKLTES